MLSFAYKRFDGVVPEPGELDDEDRALLEKVEAGFETVGELYNACQFRAAPSVPSGQAWGRPQLRSNCQADAQRQPWTARRPGSRSRRIQRQPRRRCT
jgi:methionyl-tRNA synthetase